MFRVVMEVFLMDGTSGELFDFCILSDTRFERVWRFYRDIAVSSLPRGTRISLCNGFTVMETITLPVVPALQPAGA